MHCLNDMVTNALTHVEDCLKYMLALRDPAIFRFCAIPQVDIVFHIFYMQSTFFFGNPSHRSIWNLAVYELECSGSWFYSSHTVCMSKYLDHFLIFIPVTTGEQCCCGILNLGMCLSVILCLMCPAHKLFVGIMLSCFQWPTWCFWNSDRFKSLNLN